MEMESPHPRRVAARAVGRTIEEHTALERMLARRSATRAAHSQQQQQQHDNHRRVQTQQEQQHRQPRLPRQVPSIASTAAPAAAAAAAAAANEDDRRGTRVPSPLPSLPRPSEADNHSDSPSHLDFELAIAEYPPGSPQALVLTRYAIEKHPQLSPLCKAVLVLVTQIPEGRYTTYTLLHERLLNVWGWCTRHDIGYALAESPYANTTVPCHRVIARLSRLTSDAKPQLFSFGVHCRDIRATYLLLMEEEVKFYDNGAPVREPFNGFWDIPLGFYE
ncbi:hypothetical protein F5Y06DRAFT_194064 [Hypoxylon sp. FL0890]|nr:hypothetical protein F5Y06DRAFT_194064 [Hypoxylon sp. FL0890]